MQREVSRNSNDKLLPRNSWFFKRDIDGNCVVVTANWIARQETWSMHCKVNGELVDACLADNPWLEAQSMIGSAVMLDTDEVTATVTEEAKVDA